MLIIFYLKENLEILRIECLHFSSLDIVYNQTQPQNYLLNVYTQEERQFKTTSSWNNYFKLSWGNNSNNVDTFSYTMFKYTSPSIRTYFFSVNNAVTFEIL